MRQMTPDEARLWRLMQRHVGRDNPITQEDAARALGFEGGVDTLRRKVQLLRDGVMETHRLICATSSSRGGGMGMYLPTTQADVDAYFAEVRSRSIAGLRKAMRIDSKRVRRFAEDLIAELDALEEGHGEFRPALHVSDDAPPDPREPTRGPDGEVMRCWCNAVLRGGRTRGCCDDHEEFERLMQQRRKAS